MNFVTPFMVAFFLLPFIQKFLQTKERLPEWDQRLKYARFAAFGLLAVEVVADTDFISPLVFFLLLIIASIPAYLLRNQSSASRLLLWMIVPLGLAFLIDNMGEYWVPKFHKKHHNFFESLKGIALTASFILALVARNQQKSFDKAIKEERLKREQEEETNRILEAKKLDLESQVAARTAEIMQQKEELQHALDDLKATQEQLIQSEKLASLGELTAGIAHEIQNPLNFVNNFSEVSAELVEELKSERDKEEAQRDAGLEEEILNDLVQNLQKINYHGKRAASIVTGMLQHSRAGSGKKEQTDLNALADEYLRLSYHGLRAKDKSFNAHLITDLDPNVPNIEVVPQDLGRVFLNLINNAFYAVHKKNTLGLANYEPTVWVTTKKIEDEIHVSVRDNGTGIPEEVQSKIFQPFFTTKPTGQGTGLGLSLAYDIVTKGHGGEMEMESIEGEGTTFMVRLPIN